MLASCPQLGAHAPRSREFEEHRQAGASCTVHRILADIEDEAERFTVIKTPPGGKARWTPDAGRHSTSQAAAFSPLRSLHVIRHVTHSAIRCQPRHH
ncbi:DUF6192 family protein [Streptomyces aureocirculatus]|uniref:DUF6192 family protein n=1 Tax=Streptomyces aureocirculatus TaxID=67275 RepID=UPI001CECBF06|nr:DUF6192 family protein [Streptomyces aureocirculatus]